MRRAQENTFLLLTPHAIILSACLSVFISSADLNYGLEEEENINFKQQLAKLQTQTKPTTTET